MLRKCVNDNLHGRGVYNPTHILGQTFELYEVSHKSQEQPRACKINQNEIWSCPPSISSILMELLTTQQACVV